MAIAPQEIEHFFDNVSQLPERRARLEVESLNARLAEIRQRAEELSAKPDAQPIAAEVVEQICGRHEAATRAYWAAEGRCASWFVVGPANFPVEANRKRMDTAHKRMTEVSEHLRAAKRRLERIAFPHGMGDAIRSADPQALQKLRAELERAKDEHATAKRCNALARKGDWEGVAGLIGWTRAADAKTSAERWGYPPFFLSNKVARIHRVEDRIAVLERMKARGTVEAEAPGGVRVVENAEAARIQLVFPGKPDDATRSLLKSNGFRWAPSESAWQRHLNNAGRHAAAQVLKTLATDPEAAATTARSAA